MNTALSDAFVRDAFLAAGEKRYMLARLAYPYLLGPNWRWALLGWAYIKCLDDVVDEDVNNQRAMETLKDHRRLLERTYAKGFCDPMCSTPENYGQLFYAWDQRCGSSLRAPMEAVLETMEFDLRRRGAPLSREEIDTYIVKMGCALSEILTHFAVPGRVVSVGLREAGSRAYLYADTLMDLAHDIELGLINIPAEDLEEKMIDLGAGFEAFRPWVEARVPEVEGHFDKAIRLMNELPPKTRVWCRFLLNHKRKAFRRFLNEAQIS